MGVLSLAFPLQCTGIHQFPQGAFYGTQAQGRTKIPDVPFRKAADFRFRSESYAIESRPTGFYKHVSVLKIFISRQDCTEKIFDKRNRIILSFVPSDLRIMKRTVIQILILSDLCFKRDLFSDIESVLIQQQCRQKSAHSTVAVIKWMDTKKIMDGHRNNNQRIYFHIPDHIVVLQADPVQRSRSFI